MHELTHALNFVEFLKYDETVQNFRELTLEDINKDNYTFYIAHGGLITDKKIIQQNEITRAVNLNKNYIYEALTEFIAHNVLLDDEFSDIQYFYNDNEKIDPYNVGWSYSPFVNIVFVLNYLFNEAFSMAYFTGETKISGFDNSCLNFNITDISVPLKSIVEYFNDNKKNDFILNDCVHTLVNGIKKFLDFAEETLERKDVRKHLNDFKIDSLHEEIKNVCNFYCYLRFIAEDTHSEIDKEDIERLKNILESEFSNIDTRNLTEHIDNLNY